MPEQQKRYEVRDPIHGFIAFDPLEKEILGTAPVQRLRNIKQLALTYQLYPGATHTRLEHALGVMELAGRAFDIIYQHASGNVREWMGWNDTCLAEKHRSVLRLAALLHDIGHAPFSHAAEELFPEAHPGHEWITKALIEDINGDIASVLQNSKHNTFGIKPRDLLPLAVERKVVPPSNFQEGVLSSLISGPLGVDRMDYLVRDSHHTGVAYGRFDHLRLLNTLRVTQPATNEEPQLAIEIGGLHAAEGLLLARHFMWLQVYRHPVRQIYDIHLVEFLRGWLRNGTFSTDLGEYLQMDDATVETAFRKTARSDKGALARLASRLCGRQHFRLVVRISAQERSRSDTQLDLIEVLRAALTNHFGPDSIRADEMEVSTSHFSGLPVVDAEGGLVPEDRAPRLFESVRQFWEGRVFCAPQVPQLREEVEAWVRQWLTHHELPSPELS